MNILFWALAALIVLIGVVFIGPTVKIIDGGSTSTPEQLRNQIIDRIKLCYPDTATVSEHLAMMLGMPAKSSIEDLVDKAVMLFRVTNLSEFFYNTQTTDLNILPDAKLAPYEMYSLKRDQEAKVLKELKDVYRELGRNQDLTDVELKKLVDSKMVAWTKFFTSSKACMEHSTNRKMSREQHLCLDLLNIRVHFYMHIRHDDGEKMKEIKRLRDELLRLGPKVALFDAQRLAENMFKSSQSARRVAGPATVGPNNDRVIDAVVDGRVQNRIIDAGVPLTILRNAVLDDELRRLNVDDFINLFLDGKLSVSCVDDSGSKYQALQDVGSSFMAGSSFKLPYALRYSTKAQSKMFDTLKSSNIGIKLAPGYAASSVLKNPYLRSFAYGDLDPNVVRDIAWDAYRNFEIDKDQCKSIEMLAEDVVANRDEIFDFLNRLGGVRGAKIYSDVDISSVLRDESLINLNDIDIDEQRKILDAIESNNKAVLDNIIIELDPI